MGPEVEGAGCQWSKGIKDKEGTGNCWVGGSRQ